MPNWTPYEHLINVKQPSKARCDLIWPSFQAKVQVGLRQSMQHTSTEVKSDLYVDHRCKNEEEEKKRLDEVTVRKR